MDAAVHYTYRAADPGNPARTETVSTCAPGRREYTADLNERGQVSIRRVIADRNGNTYAAGWTLPVVNAFVAKLDASGCVLFTATFEGGSANAVAADESGRIYLAGSGPGRNFPLVNPLPILPSQLSLISGFLLRLSADGGELLSSTYIDGGVNALALDADANIYLTGVTYSAAFPDSLGVSPVRPNPGLAGAGVAFVMKLPPSGDRVLFSGYAGGSERGCQCCSSCFLSYRNASGVAIGVDRERNILFAGNTDTTNLPVTEGALLARGIGAFAGKISPEGRLVYLTYLGARNDVSGNPAVPANAALALAVDSEGNAVAGGWTRDENFPATSGAAQEEYSGPVVPPPAPDRQYDAFAIKLNPTGGVIWGTFLGSAEASESAESVWIGGTGDVWAAGTDWVVRLDSSGSEILYSARLGGAGMADSAAMDGYGYIHAGGGAGVVRAFHPGGEGRVVKIANAAGGPAGAAVAPGELVSIYGTDIGPDSAAQYDALPGERAPEELGGVRVIFGGVAARLLYVSRNQINAIVPDGLATGSAVDVRIAGPAGSGASFEARVAASAPQIFRSLDGSAAALNEDGTLNSADAPAERGSVVTIWATGTAADRAGEGLVAAVARERRCCGVWMYEEELEVLYAGDAPGIVTAVSQINVRLPAAWPGFPALLRVTVGGALSEPVRIWVRP